MEEDNLSRQVDEIEALSSIYGDQWCIMDASSRRYNIEIASDNVDGQMKPLKLSLQVQLPADYPGNAPPQYQLSAPWLRGHERQTLSNGLEEIYLANCGECIIFLWVEHIREFVQGKSSEATSASSKDSPGEVEVESSLADVSESTGPSAEMATEEDADVECPEIFHGEFIHDRKSVFQGHIAAVQSVTQVQLVMDKLLENKKIAAATHNIQAYRIAKEKNGHPILVHGCVDDGEIHAGSRMLHLLEIIDATNVLVVVTRWYGGIHLGPDRFKHINNITRQMLLDHGYIKEKEDKKKGPKSSKKGK